MQEYHLPWWSRIKIRVLVFGIIMSIVPAVFISAYTIYFGKQDLEKSVQLQDKLLVERIVQEIDSILLKMEDELKNVGFSLANDSQADSQTTQIYHLLKQLPMAEEVVILDPSGNVQNGINRFKIIGNPQQMGWNTPDIIPRLQTGLVYYGPVTFSNTGVPYIRIAVPYFSQDGKSFRGGIGILVRLRSVFGLVGTKQIGSRENVFLVDETGKLIGHNDYTQVLQKTDVSNSFAVQHFLQNGDPNRLPTPNRYVGHSGEEVLGVYSKVQRTGWGVIAEQPVNVAFASIEGLLIRVVWFLLFAVTIVVLVSIIFGLYFTKPIEYMEKMVREVGHGALETRISMGRKDEIGSLMIAFDEMTEELRNQSQKLSQEKERLDTIVNGIGAGLALIHKDHTIAWMNPVLEKMIQMDQAKQLPTCYQTLSDKSAPCKDCPLMLDSEHPPAEDLITSLTNRGDQKVFRHRIYHLEHIRPGDPEYLIVVEDITEQRRMEDIVMQADKLSALGLMASGFAHEINNPLATIQAYAEDLADRLQTEREELLDSGDITRYLKIIQDNIYRSKQITQNLLNFSRKSEWKQESIDVPTVLEESLALLKHAFEKKQVKIYREWEPDLPRIHGDPIQLMQVVVNLLNNSLDAVAPTGFVGIQLFKEDDQLVMQIYDNGYGIAKEHLNKIFDPFFTTKEVGKGTGLGLSICYGIISRMGGTIAIDSQEGQGTDVTISLPIASVEQAKGEIINHGLESY